MNYQEACTFMEKEATKGSVYGLETMKALLEELGNPQDKIREIHIVGTNGKGSVGSFISSILAEHDLLVGRYSSPAVFTPREIIQFEKKNIKYNIDETMVADLTKKIKEACHRGTQKGYRMPTKFEMETALAFLAFAHCQVDFAIIEAGLGGAEDATNVMKQKACDVITSIGLDHTAFLGNSIEEITLQKSGIITGGNPVVSSIQTREARDVILSVCKEKGVLLYEADANYLIIKEDMENTRFQYKSETYEIGMKGTYQMKNAITALEVIRSLENSKILNPSKDRVKSGLQKAKWPGRFEIFKGSKIMVLDGAHNPAAARELVRSIEQYFPNQRIAGIYGAFADKDIAKVLELVAPKLDSICMIQAPKPRGMEIAKLMEIGKDVCENISCAGSPLEALEIAGKYSDVILIFGSLSILSDFRPSQTLQTREN